MKRNFNFQINARIHKDSYTDGEGEFVNSWSYYEKLSGIAPDMKFEDILKKFIEDILYKSNYNFEHIAFDEEIPNRFFVNFQLKHADDILSSDISENDIQAWKYDNLELFAIEFDIYVFESVKVDLKKELPKVDVI